MITIGHDAELFLKTRENENIPAIGLIGGSKEFPLKVTKGALQEDNVMAELNIDPATTAEEFIANTVEVLSQLELKIEPLDLSVDIRPSCVFEKKYLKSPQAREFGCLPEYNAWTMRTHEFPKKAGREQLRTCGGHIHVGWSEIESHPMNRINLVKVMDLMLGIPSVILDQDRDRRRLYGKAGLHRPKSYGIEYRVLSNFWLKNNALMTWVFNQTKFSVEALDFLYGRIDTYGEDLIQETINEGDTETAIEIVQDLQLELP